MQVTVTISDEVIREAGFRGKNVVEYVESLIDQGMRSQDRPALFSAIDRIRKLHDACMVDPKENHAQDSNASEGKSPESA